MTEANIEVGQATAVFAKQFYELLLERAKEELVGDTSALVFRGKLTEIYDTMGISGVYYTRIRKIFRKYDCVTYVERGTKAYDSVVVLNHPPPAPEILTEDDLTDREGDATLKAVAERLDEAEAVTEKLENWYNGLGGLNIVEAFRNFERRLTKLEQLAKEFQETQ